MRSSVVSPFPSPLATFSLAELRRLQIRARRLLDQGLMGQYRSAFRGHGIEFEEVREYVEGDEIRSIDWKVTARSRKPYVKSFREERELNVVVALDVSASMRTGIGNSTRQDIGLYTASVVTLVAHLNNDLVGLATFGNTVISYKKPRRLRGKVWGVLNELSQAAENSLPSNIDELCSHLSRVLKRRSVVFIISDFISPDFSLALSQLSKRHDITAIEIHNTIDLTLPSIGLVEVADPETGANIVIDTGSKDVCKMYRELAARRELRLRQTFRTNGVGHIKLTEQEQLIPALRAYFAKRAPATHFKSASQEERADG